MRRFILSLCALLMVSGAVASTVCLSGCGGTGNQPEAKEMDPAFGQQIRTVGGRSQMEEERRQEEEALEQGKPIE